MKPADVQLETYVEYGVEHNDKDPKLKVGNHVNSYTLKCSEKVFLIQKVKNTVHINTLLMILIVKKQLEDSMKKSCRRPRRQNEELKISI